MRRILATSLLAVAAACGTTAPDKEQLPAPSTHVAGQAEPEGLHNYRRWSERIGQGAQPEGERTFRTLAQLGYKTILSVDGAIPDVEGAAKYGLRYVHVPLGYNGIRRDDALKIVKAVKVSEGPVFVHCHHGLHRGPSAAAIARIAVDGVDPEKAVEDLKASGCSPKYKGLYRDVGAFRPPPEELLAQVPADLPSAVRPSDIVAAMVEIDFRWEHMKLVKSADWGAPPKNPDIDPPHEALMLREQYREMLRLDAAKAQGDAFVRLAEEAERAAAELEAALRARDRSRAERAFAAVEQNCNACHAAYRNEKPIR